MKELFLFDHDHLYSISSIDLDLFYIKIFVFTGNEQEQLVFVELDHKVEDKNQEPVDYLDVLIHHELEMRRIQFHDSLNYQRYAYTNFTLKLI